MGVVSIVEDGFERWDDDAQGRGGNVGPAGGPTVPPFVPPPQPGPLALGRKRRRRTATAAEEFGRAVNRLQSALCLLEAKLRDIAGGGGWKRLVRRANAIQAKWAHLWGGSSGPRPTYRDYLSVRQSSDDLAGMTAALFDQEAGVKIVLIELGELREQHKGWKADRVQLEAEKHAEDLLAGCDRIKGAECGLKYLLEQTDFDDHFERYHDENEGSR
jgi:hypothetical protein